MSQLAQEYAELQDAKKALEAKIDSLKAIVLATYEQTGAAPCGFTITSRETCTLDQVQARETFIKIPALRPLFKLAMSVSDYRRLEKPIGKLSTSLVVALKK